MSLIFVPWKLAFNGFCHIKSFPYRHFSPSQPASMNILPRQNLPLRTLAQKNLPLEIVPTDILSHLASTDILPHLNLSLRTFLHVKNCPCGHFAPSTSTDILSHQSKLASADILPHQNLPVLTFCPIKTCLYGHFAPSPCPYRHFAP